MGLQGDQHTSPGDLMREVRQLRREVRALQSAQPLRSSSIDSGGLTVKDGFIRWLDADGNETARFATDGLSLEGLLEVIGNIEIGGDDGKLEILDADDNVQMTLSTDGLSLTGALAILAGGAMQWSDNAGNLRLELSEKTLPAGAGDGVNLEYRDAAGNRMIFIGEHEIDGTAVHGILVQSNETVDQFDLIRASAADGTFIGDGGGPTTGGLNLRRNADQQLDLYDAAGNFRATIGPVSWSGTPEGHGIYLTSATGVDRFFASEDRFWIRTTNGQNGDVTAGAADSAGAGFRTLRIPN